MQIVNVSTSNQSIDFQIHLLIDWLLVIVILLIIIIILLSLILAKRNSRSQKNFELKNLTLKFGSLSCNYEIKRNYQNLEIAHRIYVELITRKAALPFEEDLDVIVEIYNSWYTLFLTIRTEIKGFSGETLYLQKDTEEVVKMASDILNVGLRPHLTKYQAKFRKWYEEQIENSSGKYPQDIQKEYPEYKELVADLKKVNEYLIQYKIQLEEFIYDKQKSKT
ncbi:hypothetical protein F1737_06005 [Methanoplanus sp. FWC-SCC4]|uniref:Uncharacterized protein n=1 Tax=Methanochimaera problematica TaxID=2609417 RepID=A0AA97FE04_9EURY|nr:hypothetical protein [Methanoplanus sp. FWC-SCC4]WOF16298.1 hypothetical protein F1737_06005 [Methanoplanus sp. FWC-SCC4]